MYVYQILRVIWYMCLTSRFVVFANVKLIDVYLHGFRFSKLYIIIIIILRHSGQWLVISDFSLGGVWTFPTNEIINSYIK